ncbi:SMEK domain-containing protein [Methylomonas montana]|uniref:SMEK domain-containing protein n=1 Tax=Methylomonas montana TaxID=3058963 RepID=UPI002658B7F5|nr:SMEK domain-containing protein [Methylomonas montana]WKJ90483.1 SMEK domain-containing protein [Methylomonas montana]
MNRSHYINYITDKLNSLASRIELQGSLNLLNDHIHAEIFYRDFFNLLFGWSLEKTDNSNEPGIDLIDKRNRIVVSVSSTASREKVENSLTKTNSSYKDYSFKFISISKDADNLRSKAYSNPHNLIFSPSEDIFDTKKLLKKICELEINLQKEVYEFLERELGNQTRPEQSKPIERLTGYLQDIDGWREVENEQSSIFHYEQHPEFTISENDDYYKDYEEPWVYPFLDNKFSAQLEYFIKYQGTTLDKVYLVRCDNGFLTAQPRWWLNDSGQNYFYKYYFIKNSVEYLTGRMINALAGSSNCRNPSIHDELTLFDSETEARQLIDADFAAGMHQYIYYSFDKETRKYSRIERGIVSSIWN